VLSAAALIPARAGSRRVPGKNVRSLAGHPLIAYSIAAARESGLFEAIVVSTDDGATAEVARHYGAEVPDLRPASMATSTSPDIEWVQRSIELLDLEGRRPELFSILRPTSPFRGGEVIRRAWDALLALGEHADSIRAVELCRQHPGKMWLIEGDLMTPLLDQPSGVPLHSTQYAALPEVYVQNSSLEIAWTRVLDEHGEIAGPRVAPLLTNAVEGFSIDYPEDWEAAERMVAAGEATLPAMVMEPAR
jgi:N-acylneuraminate cytidylyltransferase